eukprot:3883901-Rhodomonas_salina.4
MSPVLTQLMLYQLPEWDICLLRLRSPYRSPIGLGQAHAMRCPVLTARMILLPESCTPPCPGAVTCPFSSVSFSCTGYASGLRACYAILGTDAAYGPTRS